MRLTPEERETTIVYDQSMDEATITTADPRMLHRMRRLGIEPEVTQTDGGRVIEAEFHIPKAWIKVSAPRPASVRQRESARAVMEALNQRRQEARQRPRRRRPARKEG